MELRHLRYFVAVAEEMNIHRAAERLNISQPPLSVTIKQLEQELGVDLFSRQGRNIHITRAGEVFLERARKTLEKVAQDSLEVKEIAAGRVGRIKIGFISSAITGILQILVSQHRKEFPNIKIDVEQSISDRITEGILKKQYDIGIVRLPMTMPLGLSVHKMLPESWFVAINENHPYSKKERVTVKELEGEDLVFYPLWNGPDGYEDVMSLFRNNGFEPNIVQEAPEQMTIAGLVASGVGIGIVPQCMSHIKVERVVHRKLVGTKGRTRFALISRDEDDLLVDQFLKLAKNTEI